MMRGLEPFAKAILNPALRNELVDTPAALAMLEDADGTATLQMASYVTPEFFKAFAEVVIMSALFEYTILHALWHKVFGVRFNEHPGIVPDRDVHVEQGRRVSIGHILNPADGSSKRNLGRNFKTGATDEPEEGERVIDYAVQTASDYFGDAKYLLTVNHGYGYEENSKAMKAHPSAIRIPAMSHGLNLWDGTHNVAAFAVTNPKPHQQAWIERRTGMLAESVRMAYRIHVVYQAVGRTSVRNPRKAKSAKTFLTIGAEDARFLHSVWQGSTFLGQVGSLPALGELAAKTAGKAAGGKSLELAKAILHHLETLAPHQSSISSRELKRKLGPTVSPRTWSRAVGLVAMGADWGMERQSFVRRNAGSFGFTQEKAA